MFISFSGEYSGLLYDMYGVEYLALLFAPSGTEYREELIYFICT